MTFSIASTWLGLSLLLCVFAWFANRRVVVISLPCAALMAALAVYVPTGTPRLTSPPPGDYKILGVRIDVNVAIYALLDDGKGEPRYFRLPYSNQAANQLQAALDAAQGGQGVKANVDGQGGLAYDGPPPVSGGEPKQAEAPEISIP